MQANMGMIDRVLRVAIALAVVGLIVGGQISGLLAIILGVLAGIFLLTSVVSFCPLYMPFGISTCRRRTR